MNNPIVAWCNSSLIKFGDASHPEVPSVIQFNDGTYGNSVLTDSDSAEVSIAITNNFNNGTATADASYDMKNCSLTIKDTDGGMTDEIVQQKWVRVFCQSKAETSANYTQIGAHLDASTWVEDSYPIGCGDATVGANNISGAANDGTEAGTGKTNIARVTMKAHPDSAATPVKHSFKFRVVYTYGTGA